MLDRFKSINPVSKSIIFGTLFTRAATFMTMPFLAIYLSKVHGISPAMIGLILGVSAFTRIPGSFIGGNLSDQYGREKVMLISIFVWALVFLGFAFANHVFMFFILNALNGLCSSFFEPSSRALLSDITKQKNKLLVFNLRYAAINVGAAVGPLVGFLIGSSKSTITFVITAIVYMLYGLSLLYILPKYREVNKKVDMEKKERVTMIQALSVLRQDLVFLVAVVAFIFGVIGYSQFGSTMPQFFENASYFENGVALYTSLIILNAITVLIVQYPVTRIGKRFSPVTSIMLGTITTSIGLFGIGLFESIYLIGLSMIIFTIGEVMMFTMYDLFVDQIADPDMKGTYFGAMGFTSLGGSVGPLIGGFLLSAFGYGAPETVFGLLAFISAIGFPLFVYVNFLMKKTKRNLDYSL
ncbi:MDR family MFS transporter [Chengkuizengella axinellae]|uniref:MFS transporter n=1 Tax=Chengkuizengella axinellae TaxID=3064388 RepID=A0ABT9J2B2_9BACL|nr:MFS transporter [Chengkuizengella sp. 2205SS18-9]MDP5275756.1 MFS transporter [Chengkuizengella sp. 2205SS18-9]